jgi:glucosamine-6-phosphate deaminase
MEDVRRVLCSDRVALARETSRFVGEALAAHPGRYVGLAVGDSTLPLYARLDTVDGWAGRAITPIDELVPPPADPARSFSARLAEALPEALRARLVPIDVGPERDGRPDGFGPGPDLQSLDVEDDARIQAIRLDARLRAEGLAAVVLGLGPDGHFAFNQPPTSFDAPARVVDLTPANLARLAPQGRSRSALTMGVTTVMAAGSVLVVAAGPGKADALAQLLNGPEDPAWPITWLRRHPRLTIAIAADLA